MGTGSASDDKVSSALLDDLLQRCESVWRSVLSLVPSQNPSELWEQHLVVCKQLDAIAAVQRDSSAPIPTEQDRRLALDAFLEWADRMSIERKGVTVEYDEKVDGFGLTATDTLRKGDEVVIVPRKAILSWDQARKCAMLRKCIESDLMASSMDNVALALMVCCQRVLPDSNWQPYFHVLPHLFDTPLYFSIDQLKSLRPSPVYEESLLLFRSVARQFIYFFINIVRAEISANVKTGKRRSGTASQQERIFLNTPFTSRNFTFDLYRWAVACISTRVNMIPSADVKDANGHPKLVAALIPVLDMANHEFVAHSPLEMVHFSVEDENARIVAARDYAKGDQVTIHYGIRSNRDFLLHNGFVPINENPNDVYKLRIGLPKSDKYFKTRLELIRQIGFDASSNVFAFDVSARDGYVREHLLDFALIFVLDHPSNTSITELRSPENIQKAWIFLKNRFALLASTYKEVHDDDSPTISRSEAMIARLKRAEVQMLRDAEKLCEEHIHH